MVVVGYGIVVGEGRMHKTTWISHVLPRQNLQTKKKLLYVENTVFVTSGITFVQKFKFEMNKSRSCREKVTAVHSFSVRTTSFKIEESGYKHSHL